MLEIKVPGTEGWDEEKEEFVSTKEQTLRLEHSLVSLSKWESKWHKPYLTKDEKSDEETIDYIKYMTITSNVSPEVYYRLSQENLIDIRNYIEDPMTATIFNERISNGAGKLNKEQITSEIIYYWMIALNIPVEFQKWHLNRLLTLIKVCNIKNEPPKKMNRRDVINRNRELNAARKKKLNTKG